VTPEEFLYKRRGTEAEVDGLAQERGGEWERNGGEEVQHTIQSRRGMAFMSGQQTGKEVFGLRGDGSVTGAEPIDEGRQGDGRSGRTRGGIEGSEDGRAAFRLERMTDQSFAFERPDLDKSALRRADLDLLTDERVGDVIADAAEGDETIVGHGAQHLGKIETGGGRQWE
jgi:hypothetical protein